MNVDHISAATLEGTAEQIAHPVEKLAAPNSCLVCGSTFREEERIVARDLNLCTPGTQTIVVCANCGSGTTLPVVPESEFEPFYTPPGDDSEYGNYDQWKPNGLLARMIALAKGVHSFVKSHTLPFKHLRKSPGRALDIGCGTGEVSCFLRRYGWDTLGIEPDERTAEFARSRGLDVETGTLSDFSSDPAAFDAVVFHHVLEHVADPAAALSTARAALKSDGRLIVCIPNFASWQRRLFKHRWYSLDTPRHRHHMTPKGLRSLAERSGFKVEAIGTGVSLSALPGSIEISVLDKTSTQSGLSARLRLLLSTLALAPIDLIVSRVTRRGDVINLVATPSQADGR